MIVTQNNVNLSMDNSKILRSPFFSALISASCVLFSFPLLGAQVHVAVASNFTVPVKQLIAEYQQLSSDKIVVSPGSSGKIYAQILRGAPFDIFLSADQQKPMALEQQDLIQTGSRFTYATGSLVLWSKHATLLQPDTELSKLNFERLAVANPRIAPYGKAAMQALERLNINTSNQKNLVFGENISQTFAFVATGNASLGFIALSQYQQLKADQKGSAWSVPTSYHAPIRQDAVLLKRANSAASHFYAFLKSRQAREMIAEFGYEVATISSDLTHE